MKNLTKGITLVSLVVTIIVLIILAGVSINLVLGENGIITRAKQAKTKAEQATLNEQIALNELYVQMEAEDMGLGGTSYDAIAKIKELENKFSDLQNEFNNLQSEYSTFKTAIADYIGEAGGVQPAYTADETTFGDSIKNIVTEVTKDATATADDIASEKTAYVNGQLITGNANNAPIITKIYNYSASLPVGDNKNYSGSKFTVDVKTLYPSTYTSFTNSNFYFITTKAYAYAEHSNDNNATPGINLNWSYDSNTGILTVSNLGCSVGGRDDAEVKITEGYVILIT